jgi:hypothetical protein
MLHLSATGLRWQDSPSVMPEKGQKVVLDVYLHPQFPKPVSLSGSVKEITQVDGGLCVCRVVFDELPETLHDQLEKLIFTHHRREVAHARHHS